MSFPKKEVPREKLVLGIPVYGYDWGESTPTESVTYEEAVAKANRHNAALRWTKDAAPWFTYESAGKRHTVWFENARSAAGKMDIPEARNIRGFSFFRLGIEDPRFWPRIEKRVYAVY